MDHIRDIAFLRKHASGVACHREVVFTAVLPVPDVDGHRLPVRGDGWIRSNEFHIQPRLADGLAKIVERLLNRASGDGAEIQCLATFSNRDLLSGINDRLREWLGTRHFRTGGRLRDRDSVAVDSGGLRLVSRRNELQVVSDRDTISSGAAVEQVVVAVLGVVGHPVDRHQDVVDLLLV